MTTDNDCDTRGYGLLEDNGLWSYIDGRVLAYGFKVIPDVVDGLIYIDSAMKAVA